MEKVLIGLSGGVDSSVAALLLKKMGYEVIGVTFKTLPDFDTTDAEKVAKNLNIEHHIIDITNEFKNIIINKFLKDYQNGLTPNPCVICNKFIKFKKLFNELEKYDAKYLATGHYAKIINNKIYKSSDLNKDQSYFLCQIDKNLIPKILFPLEGLSKEEIRQIAKDNNLITANKKDSYDVCFIKNGFREFAKKNLNIHEGNIINLDNNTVIGRHNGLELYTIGQRRGLNIGGSNNRLFVVKKDVNMNTLYVASKENKYLYANKIIVKDFNYLTDELYTECQCKFRYHQEDIECKINYLDNNTIEVLCNNVKAVTIGQYCVLYKDDMCLGGGIISKIIN